MAKDDFGAFVTEWASDAQVWAAAEAAKKTRAVFIKVAEFSPRQGYGRFSTGHFLRNWRAGPFALSGEVAGEATLAQKVSEIEAVIDDEFFMTNTAAYLSNGTHYANNIEELGWHEGGQNTPAYAPVAKAIAASME